MPNRRVRLLATTTGAIAAAVVLALAVSGTSRASSAAPAASVTLPCEPVTLAGSNEVVKLAELRVNNGVDCVKEVYPYTWPFGLSDQPCDGDQLEVFALIPYLSAFAVQNVEALDFANLVTVGADTSGSALNAVGSHYDWCFPQIVAGKYCPL